MADPVFKFVGLEAPKPTPKEGYPQKLWRIATDPIAKTVGLGPALDEFAHAKASDGPITSRLRGFASGALGSITPGTLAEIATLPAMAAEVPAAAAIRNAPLLGRVIKSAAGISEAVPAGVQAVSGISSGLQSARGAVDTAHDLKEGNYGRATMDALGTTLGAVGARSGLRGYQQASRSSKALAAVTDASKASGQSGLRVAVKELQNKPLGSDVLGDNVSSHDAARIAKMFPNGEPATAPTTAEEVAKHAAIREELKKNPGGGVAKAIFGEDGVPKGYFSSDEAGAPKDLTDAPVVEHGAMEDAALAQRAKEAETFNKANTNSASADIKLQADLETEQAKAAKDRVNEINAGFKANADANSGLSKAEETARKAGVKDDTQHAKNLNVASKKLEREFSQSVNAKNSRLDKAQKEIEKDLTQQTRNENTTNKYTKGIETAENKATADALKTREAGFAQEAKNENTREKFQRSLLKAREDAGTEDVKRNTAAVTQADAENQANTLDNLKGTLTEVHEPTSISETITGPGEHGGTERATYRRQAPEPEEGEGGALGGGSNTGGSGPQAPDPTLLHYTRASAVKEANRLGGPNKWDITKPRDGVFKLVPHEPGTPATPTELSDMGLGGEPPADAAPTGDSPTPDAPTPPSPSDEGLAHLSPVEKDSLFNKSMSQKEANVLAKHLGLEVTQAGPGTRNFRVKRPEGVEPYVEPASPEVSSEPDGPSSTFLGKTLEPEGPKTPQQPNKLTPREQREALAMQERSDAQRANAGLPPQKLPDGSLSAEVTDFEGGDTPTLDVEPPSGKVPSAAPEVADGGATPSGPEFDAYKKKYQDLYAKMMGASSEEAGPHINNLMDHFDSNPAWGEHLSNNVPSVEPEVPSAPSSPKSVEMNAGTDRTASLFNDAHNGELPTDLNPHSPNSGGDITEEELARARVERANPANQMPVAPPTPAEPPMSVNEFATALSKEGNKPIVPVNMPNSPVKTGLHGPDAESGNLFGEETPKDPTDLFNQPEEPIAPPVPPAPPVPEGGAIPARLFKSKIDHINDPEMGYPATQAALKAGELPTSPHAPVDSRGRPSNTARQQGAVKAALNKPQVLAEAPAPVAPAAPVDDVADIQAQINSASTDPTTREVLKRYLKNFMSEKGIGGGQVGAISPELTSRLGGAVLGGAAGNQMDPLDNKTGSTTVGAATGFFAPELAHAAYKAAPALENALGDNRENIAKGAKFFNQLHNSALLSPLSVIKKAGGDIGGVTMAAFEHPERAGDIMKQFLTREGRGNFAKNFREGYSGPAQEASGGLDLSGAMNSNLNPLSWSGKTMSGLTTATKGVLGESGFSSPEQRYYTLTDYPHYETTKNLYNGIRQGDFMKHLIPFARVGINRLERGYEYSPLGLANKLMKSHAGDANIAAKAGIGTGAGIAAYQATPENFIKDHPIMASTGAAFAGPLGLPVLAGMALKNSHRQPNDPYHLLPDTSKLSDATGEIARDVPGLRLIEDASGKNPEGFARNYFSGYTNSMRPLALAKQYLEQGNTEDPDLSSKDLTETQKIFNRTLSNVPGLRETLPKKKVSLTAPTFKFKF